VEVDASKGHGVEENTGAEKAPELRKLSLRAKKEKLRLLYLNSNKRIAEIGVMCIYAVFWPYMMYTYSVSHISSMDDIILSVACFIVGMFIADFISGVLHWSFDTWGTVEAPLFGQFIRSFREHHLDATEMCNHDFVETNSDSLIGSLVLVPPSIYLAHNFTPYSFAISTTFCWVSLLTGFSNEIHKWSHQRKPNTIVKVLQDLHIILPAKHHKIHHTSPHDVYYCMTNGWCNPILTKVGFWRKFEKVITFFTGAVPREDDFSWLNINPNDIKKE